MTDNQKDTKIKELFETYQPEMTADSSDFIKKIDRDIRIVEMVGAKARKEARNNRRALVFSALAGFVAGVIAMLLMPAVNEVFAGWLSDLTYAHDISQSNVIGYLFFVAAVALAVTATYSGLRSVQVKSRFDSKC